MIFRVKRSPFSPSGEKVADRPDEGAFEDGSIQKRPPPPVFPPSLLRMLRGVSWQDSRKKWGIGGKMALSSYLRSSRQTSGSILLPAIIHSTPL